MKRSEKVRISQVKCLKFKCDIIFDLTSSSRGLQVVFFVLFFFQKVISLLNVFLSQFESLHFFVIVIIGASE